MSTTVAQNLWQHDGVIFGSLIVLLIEFRGPGRLGTLAQGIDMRGLARVSGDVGGVPGAVRGLGLAPVAAAGGGGRRRGGAGRVALGGVLPLDLRQSVRAVVGTDARDSSGRATSRSRWPGSC